MVKTWLPLESNPEVMTTFAHKMGCSNLFQYHDIFSTESWALDMIPRPCLGVLMLFPIKDGSEEYAATEKAKIESDGQILSQNVFYMKQTVGNACGTVGILHSLLNVKNIIEFEPDSYLAKFNNETSTLNPEERAIFLENDEEIENTHEDAANEGQTEASDEPVNSHFVCFTHVDGHLYELDGRKAFPINHGPSNADTLLEDAVKAVQKFMERDPEETGFTMVALAPIAPE